MQAVLTYCNTRTDGLTFPQPVENPLASLALIACILRVQSVFYSIIAEASAKRERFEIKLNEGAMGVLRMILIIAMTSDIFAIFSPS